MKTIINITSRITQHLGVRLLITLAFVISSYNTQAQIKIPESIMNSQSLTLQIKASKIDTSYTFKQAKDTLSWMKYEVKYTLYDTLDQLIGYEKYRYNAKIKRYEKLERQYNYYENKQLLESLIQKFDKTTNRWYNIKLKSLTYNSLGLASTLIYSDWKKGSNKWYNSVRYLISYNSDKLKNDVIIKLYVPKTKSWINNTKYTFGYEQMQIHPYVVYVEKWNSYNNKWSDFGRYSLKFDFLGNKTYESRATWSPIIHRWINALRFYMTYSGDLLTKQVKQMYNYSNSKWQNSANVEYIYKNKTLTKSINEKWNNVDKKWDTTAIFLYTPTNISKPSI